jgi:hypothetical protein
MPPEWDPTAVDFLADAESRIRSVGSRRFVFGLARACDVRLELFDVAGRQVQTLVSGAMSAGSHAAVWNGRDQEPGNPGRERRLLRAADDAVEAVAHASRGAAVMRD